MARAPIVGEVFAIGDEILQGWTTDTNSGEIARELMTVGVRVARFTGWSMSAARSRRRCGRRARAPESW